MAQPTLIDNDASESPARPELQHQDAFEQAIAALPDQPDWLIERRQKAWDAFQTLPLPSRKDEQWRFATLNRNVLNQIVPGNGVDAETADRLASRSSFIADHAGQYVFADNQLIDSTPLDPELAEKGVRFVNLETALRDHTDLIEPIFLQAQAELGSEKFVALHKALVTNGTFLFVPRGVEMSKPVVAVYWSSAASTAVFPHTLILAEDNTSVNLVDIFLSDNPEAAGFACSMANIHGGANSRVMRKVVQDWNENTFSFQNDLTIAERDSVVKNVAVNIGALKSRYENMCRIVGPGADVKMYSLTVGEKHQEFDQRTLQVHEAPHATSDLLYKNSLMDECRTIFSGLIVVDDEAQQTDAYQTNRNLLLDHTAEANSLPGLEIKANDVKCSHGATTARLEEEELFYLMARGIPERTAKRLLVFGFFEEIIEKVSNQELAEKIRDIVHHKFTRHQA